MIDRSPPAPIVALCLSEPRRRRVESAIDGGLKVRSFSSLAALAEGMADAASVEVVVVERRDPEGTHAHPTLSHIARLAPDASVVLYGTMQELAGGEASHPAIQELILAGQTDSPHGIRQVLFNAVNRRAADVVVAELRRRLPDSLALFAATAVRFPTLGTVERVSAHLGIHRQTAAVWSRKASTIHPEELIIWSRLLLFGRLVEKTNRSVSSLATDLEFSSVIALRNTLKRYTRMTALEVRAAGLDAVLRQFDARLAACQQGIQPRRPAAFAAR